MELMIGVNLQQGIAKIEKIVEMDIIIDISRDLLLFTILLQKEGKLRGKLLLILWGSK